MDLIKDATSNGCRYFVACNDMGVDVKTIKRWKRDPVDKREGPKSTPSNKLSAEERSEVLLLSTSKEYVDLPPCQIVPRLTDKGVYVASEASFYRILREENLLEHRGKSKPRSNIKPKPLIAYGPNEVYSWDITYLKNSLIRGRFFYLYMFMDICSRKIVGEDVYEEESMELSSALIDRICKKEGVGKNQVTLHADNGGAMKGATMLATLQRLGVVPSFSRPRVSDDNPFSESLFKTLKYCPEYQSKGFSSLFEARAWVKRFVYWYNNVHLHSGINFVTPNDRHEGKDAEVLEKRKHVYELAIKKNPNRWSKGITRNWSKTEEVYLNHLQK